MDRIRGVTLLELLVVLALTGLIFGMAVPAFGNFVDRNRNTATANRLVGALILARSASIRRGHQAVVCPLDTHHHCRPGGDWSRGWMVFVNTDADYPPQRDPGEALLRLMQTPEAESVESNRHVYVMRPFGKRSTNGTLSLCSPRGRGKAVIVSVTGRPRVDAVRPDGSSVECP